MARWSSYRRRRYYRRTGRKWTPVNQVASVAMGAGQMSVAIAHNRLNEKGVGPYNIGPIMKVKNFRINAVFAASLSVLWALVYVPEGLPIGSLNIVPTTGTSGSLTGAFYEPQQYLIASGVYSSAASAGGMNAGPLRVWSPMARNLNPGDRIFFLWRAFDFTGSADALITFNYVTCVN